MPGPVQAAGMFIAAPCPAPGCCFVGERPVCGVVPCLQGWIVRCPTGQAGVERRYRPEQRAELAPVQLRLFPAQQHPAFVGGLPCRVDVPGRLHGSRSPGLPRLLLAGAVGVVLAASLNSQVHYRMPWGAGYGVAVPALACFGFYGELYGKLPTLKFRDKPSLAPRAKKLRVVLYAPRVVRPNVNPLRPVL